MAQSFTVSNLNLNNDSFDEPKHKSNLQRLIDELLTPLQKAWEAYCQSNGWKDGKIKISSGYRNKKHNSKVSYASKTSAHLIGFAADINPSNGKKKEFYQWLRTSFLRSGVRFDQCICPERNKSGGSWAHIALANNKGEQRMKVFEMYAESGKAVNAETVGASGSLAGNSSYEPSYSGSSSASRNDFEVELDNSLYDKSGTVKTEDWDPFSEDLILTKDNLHSALFEGLLEYYDEDEIDFSEYRDFNESLDEDIEIDDNGELSGYSDGTVVILYDVNGSVVDTKNIETETKKPNSESRKDGDVEFNDDSTNQEAFEENVFGSKIGLSELIQNSISTNGDVAGETSTKKMAKFYQKTSNLIEALDGSDADKGSGSDKSNKLDPNGKVVVSYGKCSVCGKPLTKPTNSGTCSRKCQIKHNKDMITGDLKKLQDAEKNIQGKISNITSATNSLMSSVADMTGMLTDIRNMNLDKRYLDYFKVRINTLIQYIKQKIQKALVSKNYKLLRAIQTAKGGIDSAEGGILSVLKSVQKAIAAAKALLDQFMVVFDVAFKMVCSIIPFTLNEDSLHFGFTPKSFLMCPGKFACALPNNNINNSCGNIMFADKIETIVRKAFPPLKDTDYILPPAVFKVRKIFSEENTKTVQMLMDTLSMIMKGPTDPLPTYEHLKISNIWFLIFILSSWGPNAMKHFGMPLYP